jgi:hypothetical protein
MGARIESWQCFGKTSSDEKTYAPLNKKSLYLLSVSVSIDLQNGKIAPLIYKYISIVGPVMS